MASESGYQTITIYILPNISRSKSNQTVTFGQLVEYNKTNIFPKNAENDARKLVPDLFLFLRKTLYEAKASGLQFKFSIF